MAGRRDPIEAGFHAHDIFIVNKAPRRARAKTISPGVVWGVDQGVLILAYLATGGKVPAWTAS